MKQHVGIVIDWYLPRLGGGELYAYNLGKFLIKAGYRVSFFTLDEKNTADYVDEFPVTRVPFKPGIWGKIEFYRALKKYLNGVNIIHAVYCHKFAAYASIYNFFRHKPFIITLEGRGILDLPGNSWLYSRVHSLYRLISLKCADAIIASCLEFVDRAQKYTRANKITYIPNGVDISVFRSQPANAALAARYAGRKMVLTVRRLVPKNGLQFLVEAAPLIVAQYPDVLFVLIGYGELEDYLRRRATELGLSAHIEFAGRVENTLIPAYLERADVVVFPSTAEATSLACLEAMAMKKAIIASNVGGYPEMIIDGTTGFLVTLVDWRESNYDAPLDTSFERKQVLAERINQVLADLTLAKRLGEAAYQKVQKDFNWDVLIERIVRLYQTIGGGIHSCSIDMREDLVYHSMLIIWFKKMLQPLRGMGLWKIPGVLWLYKRLYQLLRPKKGIILVTCQGSKLYVDASDQGMVPSLMMHGVYEAPETVLFKSLIKPGMVIVDVGANVGYYTLLAARCFSDQRSDGVIYAFEPEPTNFGLLVKNIAINGYTTIMAHQEALADKPGTLRLFTDRVNTGNPSLTAENVPASGGSVEVAATTLDLFLSRGRVDLIKVDIQGAEGLFFAGAYETLQRSPLKILMEFWPYGLRNLGTDPLELLNKLQGYGFTVQRITATSPFLERVDPVAVIAMCENNKQGRGFINLFLEK